MSQLALTLPDDDAMEPATGKRKLTSGAAASKKEEGSSSQVDSKMLLALARVCLHHEDDLRQRAREENLVLVGEENNPVMVALDASASHYSKVGDARHKEVKEKGLSWTGHPLGPKPTALLKAMLYRLAEAATLEHVKIKELAANWSEEEKAAAEKVLQQLARAGEEAKASADDRDSIRASRCFRVSSWADDKKTKLTKWILAARTRKDIHELLEMLGKTGILAVLQLKLESDFGPRSQAAKEISELIDQLPGKGEGKGKNKK